SPVIKPAQGWGDIKKRKIHSENEIEVEGKRIMLVNIEKELWPGTTKGDLIQYYISLAPHLLPHLKNRPLAINFNLEGPFKEGFFLRGLEGNYPKWANVFRTERKHKKQGKSNTIEWLVCNDL